MSIELIVPENSSSLSIELTVPESSVSVRRNEVDYTIIIDSVDLETALQYRS